jgi:transposase
MEDNLAGALYFSNLSSNNNDTNLSMIRSVCRNIFPEIIEVNNSLVEMIIYQRHIKTNSILKVLSENDIIETIFKFLKEGI